MQAVIVKMEKMMMMMMKMMFGLSGVLLVQCYSIRLALQLHICV